MDYLSSEDSSFNNESPWSMNTSEIMVLLADNAIRQDVSPRTPIKCWIPTLMGDIQTPKPAVIPAVIRKSIFVNSNECKLPISDITHVQNYITVQFGDHDYYYHKYIDHGKVLWGTVTNYSTDEIYVDTSCDPSYCDNCAAEHPWFQLDHGYNPNWHCPH